MYLPDTFSQQDMTRLHAIVRDYPLALLVVVRDDVPVADPVPLILVNDGDRTLLRGHVARSNPLASSASPASALAVFSGPQCYISPGWYASKQEHGRVVPTWNYISVQASGMLRLVDDPGWIRALLDTLTEAQERAMPAPWAPADAPAGYLCRMLAAVVGLELEVTQWQGKFKLSQNQPPQNRDSVVAALQASSDPGDHIMAQQIIANTDV